MDFLSQPDYSAFQIPSTSVLKSLLKYKEINDVIFAAATVALSRHLRYLSEEMVALVFYDHAINYGVKRNMVKELQNPGLNEPPKCIQMQASSRPLFIA